MGEVPAIWFEDLHASQPNDRRGDIANV